MEILDDSDFWKYLADLEAVLYPYCAALNILQKDKARLYEVLHSFGYFMQCILNHPDSNFKIHMQQRLEKRWKA